MKKIFTLLLIAIAATMAAVFASACSGEHTHTFGEVETITAATCTEKGLGKRTCTECGESEDVELPALGHDFTAFAAAEGDTHTRSCKREGCDYVESAPCDYEVSVIGATCEHGGYTESLCSVCGRQNITDETPISDHIYEGWVFDADLSRKEGKNMHSQTCVFGCGETLTGECEESAYTIEADCDDGGYTRHSCEYCSNTYNTDEVDALGHDLVDVDWIPSETDGTHYRICARDNCGAVFTESCSYDEDTTPASCEEDGNTTKTCTVCHDEIITVLPATGHDYGTEKEDYEYVGDTVNPDGEHQHKRVCKNGCGIDLVETCQFSTETKDPTCTDDGYEKEWCDLCGHEHSLKTIDKLNHDFDTAYTHVEEGGVHKHFKKCKRPDCNEVDDYGECSLVETEHNDATCDMDETIQRACQKCGYAETESGEPATGHSWTYTANGHTGGPETPYTHKRTCGKCGKEEDNIECVFTPTTTQSTCTTAGYTTYNCDDCENSYVGDETDPTGHSWGDYITVEGEHRHKRICQVETCREVEEEACEGQTDEHEATCEDDAYTVYKCYKCHDEYTETFDGTKKNHLWGAATYAGVIDGKYTHVQVCEHDSNHKLYTACSEEGDGTVVAPKCNKAGYTQHVCAVCQNSYTTDPTEPTREHNWGPWTYSLTSMHRHECRDCGMPGYAFCNPTTQSKDPTCTEDGGTYTVCTDCEHEFSRVVRAALGHDYGAPVHDEGTYEEGENHSYHTITCQRGDCGHSERIQCVLVETANAPATCTTAQQITQTCKDGCGYSVTADGEQAVLGHSWGAYTNVEGTSTHTTTCSVCGEVSEPAACSFNETFQEADCEHDQMTIKTCNDCGHVEKELTGDSAYGHQWDELVITDETHQATCQREGCRKTITGSHDYSESNICKDCHHDGLVYRLSDSQTYYIVEHDNFVLGAKKIIIPDEIDGIPVEEIESSGVLIKKEDSPYRGQRCGFYNNSSVEEVELPETLKVIGSYAFESCINLRTVTVRNENENDFEPSLERIGDNAFFGCKKLQSAKNLPASLKYIGSSAFYGCEALNEIELPESLDLIGRNAFTGTAYVADGDNWTGDVLYISNHLISAKTTIGESCEITPGTTSVGISAFENCKNLKTITIPTSVKRFDYNAFAGCEFMHVHYAGTFMQWMEIVFDNDEANPAHMLKKDDETAEFHIENAQNDIVIPSTVTAIPAGTFKGTTITSVEIPETVTYIGPEAFMDCESLATVTVKGSAITDIGKDAFTGSAFYNDGQNWTGSAKENGALYLKNDDDSCRWLIKVATVDQDFAIDGKTKAVAAHAFEGAAAEGDVELTLPDSVTHVGDYAFKDFTNLKKLTFGTGISYIGRDIFNGCYSTLQGVYFKKSAMWMTYSDMIGRTSQTGPEKNSLYDFKLYIKYWKYLRDV